MILLPVHRRKGGWPYQCVFWKFLTGWQMQVFSNTPIHISSHVLLCSLDDSAVIGDQQGFWDWWHTTHTSNTVRLNWEHTLRCLFQLFLYRCFPYLLKICSCAAHSQERRFILSFQLLPCWFFISFAEGNGKGITSNRSTSNVLANVTYLNQCCKVWWSPGYFMEFGISLFGKLHSFFMVLTHPGVTGTQVFFLVAEYVLL